MEEGVLNLRAEFLSTPSVRRATPLCGLLRNPHKFLSTPSVRRATTCTMAF